MSQKKAKTAAKPKADLTRQIIFSLAALGIMGLGAWSLTGQSAPYHPEGFEDEVSRGSATELTGVSD